MPEPFPTDSMELTHILVVGDLGRSVRFYRDVLDEEVQADLGDPRIISHFRSRAGRDSHIAPSLLRIWGLGTTATRAEQNEARRQLDELRAQLAGLTPDQRTSLEGPLNDQIDRLLGITEGRLAMALRVTDLQVEPTPPGR